MAAMGLSTTGLAAMGLSTTGLAAMGLSADPRQLPCHPADSAPRDRDPVPLDRDYVGP